MFVTKIRRAAVATVALSLLALSVVGCAKKHAPAVFGYVSCNASFTMVFHSPNGDVECAVVKSDDGMTLRVVSPERSADLMVICAPDGCVITPKDGGEGIPLSADASRGLTDVFSILYRGSDGSESVSRSSDGQSTVIAYRDGEVTIGADLMPLSVKVIDGIETRTVTIWDYRAE